MKKIWLLKRWRDVVGYEGLYEVDWNCNVRSLNYNHTGITQIVKARKRKDGYLQVYLYKDGKQTTFTNHRIGMQAWIPNPENKPCVNHKTHVRTENNVFTQLEWCTYKQNIIDAQEFGTLDNKGEKHGRCKFSDAIIDRVHELRALGRLQREIAAELLMSRVYVCNILSGKRRNHSEIIS